VTGDPDRLVKILLHGLEGPVTVSGKNYEPPHILPAMPPVGMMADTDIAAILTYIRRAWGHNADPVSSGEVRKVRDLNLERRTAWTAKELLAPAPAAR
jgi:mono/diheme cytochrome c family protein